MSDTSAGGLAALCGAFTGLSVVTTALRFYVRRHQKVPLKTDDWMIVLAAIAYIGAAICIWYGISIKEFGYPIAISAETIAPKSRDLLEICIDILTILGLGFTKASALYFYKRVFCAVGNKGFKYVLNASLLAVAIWVVIMEFLTGFQCNAHFSALWGPLHNKYCTISEGFLLALSISDVILDVWVLSLPIPMILRLHADLARKLSIIGVFLMGLAGLGAGIGRLVIIVQVNHLGPIGIEHVDAERVETKIAFFYMLETGTWLLAMNMISLWPFFSKIAPEAFLRGMRSMSSLGSGRSGRSGAPAENPSSKNSGQSMSAVYSASEQDTSHESYAMADRNEGTTVLPNGKILVHSSVKVDSNQKKAHEYAA